MGRGTACVSFWATNTDLEKLEEEQQWIGKGGLLYVLRTMGAQSEPRCRA